MNPTPNGNEAVEDIYDFDPFDGCECYGDRKV